MTVHHLPKPIPDGDPNHQSRNFLVPGKSAPAALPSPLTLLSACGTHGTNRCRARFFAEWSQPPLPEGGARSCDTNSGCWPTTPGASRDPESLRVAENARFLPRTCQEHRPAPGELWPCSQPRPSPQFLVLPPRPTCIYPTPSPLATTPSSWEAWRAHLPKHHLICVHLWGASLSSPASLPLPAFLIVKSQAHLDARPLENRAWTPHPPVQPPDPHKWPCMWEVIGKCLLKPSSSPEHPLLAHVHTRSVHPAFLPLVSLPAP